VVPLNIRLAAAELIYLLNDSEAAILIVDDAFKSMLPELIRRARGWFNEQRAGHSHGCARIH